VVDYRERYYSLISAGGSLDTSNISELFSRIWPWTIQHLCCFVLVRKLQLTTENSFSDHCYFSKTGQQTVSSLM